MNMDALDADEAVAGMRMRSMWLRLSSWRLKANQSKEERRLGAKLVIDDRFLSISSTEQKHKNKK